MAFLYPSFLWALTALAIPIVIHLFQLRRFKRIDFPNVRFLKEVSQQTRQRRKVQHWMVLLARCLALAALVLAFAQPYLPTNDARVRAGRRAVSIYIDNSQSMDGQNAGGRLLDQARAGAQDAIMAYAATDRFQVVTGELEGRQQLLTGRDEALEAAARVDVSPYSRKLSQVFARQREALATDDSPVRRTILFSDLQRTTTDVEAWTSDSLVGTVIVPVPPSAVDNLSIDSVWSGSPVHRPGQNEVLHVRIRNRGTAALENIPLRLSIDGQQRAVATFAVEAGAAVDTALRFTNDVTGPHWGEVSISDRPVTFDDRLFIAYRTSERARVLLVSGGDAGSDARISAVYTGDSSHVLTTQNWRSLDLGALARTDLVVLNALPEMPSGLAGALEAFVDAGGSLAVFPADESEVTSYTALFSAFGADGPGRRDTSTMKVDRIDLQQPFYREVFSTMPRNVDLPQVRTRYALRAPASADVLLRLQDGSAFLCAIPRGKGQVYLCAAPLGGSSEAFTRHALFVTSLLRMAELSRPGGALYHTIGETTAIALEAAPPAGDVALHLKGPDGIDRVPELRRTPGGAVLVLHETALPDGPYAVVGADGDTLQTIALDLSRAESDLAAYTPEELRALIEQRGLTGIKVLDSGPEDLSISLKQLDEGRRLWKWFVVMALVFLAAEIALIRWWT